MTKTRYDHLWIVPVHDRDDTFITNAVFATNGMVNHDGELEFGEAEVIYTSSADDSYGCCLSFIEGYESTRPMGVPTFVSSCGLDDESPFSAPLADDVKVFSAEEAAQHIIEGSGGAVTMEDALLMVEQDDDAADALAQAADPDDEIPF